MKTDDQWGQACAEAARLGGEILLQWRGKFAAREKGPKDLVTEADFASQEAIQKFLLDRFPDTEFLGEERPEDIDLLHGEKPCWVVDPLDGTTNYVHGMPAFSVSVALAQRGRVLAGAVYDPIARENFVAVAGGGARLNGETIRASECESIDQALIAASFSTAVHRESEEVKRFVRVLTECQALRRLGSAALNLCYVAAGRLDGYWATSVKAWDMAAGALLVQEAGGVITHFEGGPVDLFDPQLTAASTGALHERLGALLHASNGSA